MPSSHCQSADSPHRAAGLSLVRVVAAFLGLFVLAAPAAAEGVGTVTHFSGMLITQKPSGAIKVLGVNSEVEAGDVLVTDGSGYAQIRFIDDQQVTLRPNTRLQVEDYQFKSENPEADSAILSLIKGGLRAITGLVGKRAKKSAYQVRTTTATIGIRGTHFGVLLCQDDCTGPSLPASRSLDNGLYVDVTEGSIVVANQGGSEAFSAGQFGFVRNQFSAPTILPADPGSRFTPPPRFDLPAKNRSSAAPGGASDCVIQ